MSLRLSMALWSISGAANRSFSMVNQADKFPNDVGLESCIIMHNGYLSSGGFEILVLLGIGIPFSSVRQN
jgi:hypothetical protein